MRHLPASSDKRALFRVSGRARPSCPSRPKPGQTPLLVNVARRSRWKRGTEFSDFSEISGAACSAFVPTGDTATGTHRSCGPERILYQKSVSCTHSVNRSLSSTVGSPLIDPLKEQGQGGVSQSADRQLVSPALSTSHFRLCVSVPRAET